MADVSFQKQNTATHTQDVKTIAASLGFDACGIAHAGPIDPNNALRKWLAQGFQADMQWMERNTALREDITNKLPNAQSVIVVARNYYTERPHSPKNAGKVARYAFGRDYHKVMRKPLIKLAKYLESIQIGTSTYISLDTGPVLERAWAQQAGVGSIGKNTMAIRRDIGSWFFLGTIATTLPLLPDSPSIDVCGTCRACLDACPTHAFPEPYVLDANKCISYQTIENRGEIPTDLHASHGDWVFGCDVCQEVCPWNRFAQETNEIDFHPRPNQPNPDLDHILAMDEATFNDTYQGTPIRRTKHKGFKRNAEIAKGNQA